MLLFQFRYNTNCHIINRILQYVIYDTYNILMTGSPLRRSEIGRTCNQVEKGIVGKNWC